MRKYLVSEKGFEEIEDWKPHSWISVECPDADDYAFLEQEFEVPNDFLQYTADRDEVQRIERDGDWIFTVIRVPVISMDPAMEFKTVPIGIISNRDVIITVCNYNNEILSDFITESRQKKVQINDVANFTMRLIYTSTKWYLKYLTEINTRVNEEEKKLEGSVKNDDILLLMKLQRSLVVFTTSINGNQLIIDRLNTVFANYLDADLLEDVEIELKQAENTSSVYSAILNGTTDAFGSVISNNVNAVMKRLTTISLVLMVPTLIASFYGMNVRIGLADLKYAFWYIIGASALITWLLIWLCNRWKLLSY
ncbi:MAG: magnesium transporter CorA family protein [Muribaculum sp.]|nr:magnesium transporter CorA family protein [Muribaculum sp.]